MIVDLCGEGAHVTFYMADHSEYPSVHRTASTSRCELPRLDILYALGLTTEQRVRRLHFPLALKRIAYDQVVNLWCLESRFW